MTMSTYAPVIVIQALFVASLEVFQRQEGPFPPGTIQCQEFRIRIPAVKHGRKARQVELVKSKEMYTVRAHTR